MKKKIDYRHFITIFITLGFVAFGFLFPNAIPRLYESCRNIVLSIGYSFVKIADPSNDSFIVTVLNMPSIEFAPSPWKPLFSITWEEFKTLVYTYFSAFTLKENLIGYLYIVLNTVYYIVRFSTPLILFILIIKRVLAIFTAGTNNNDNVDSKPLKVFKWILKHVFGPVWAWIKEYVLFLRGTAIYLKIWAWIWALHLNIISIVVDFFAYFFYFSASFAVESLWSQVQKFVFDISPMVRFFPAWVWIILISYGYARICRNIAYSALYHRERMNRGFINERGVVSIVYGSMGVGKTALITDMALSAEVELRDRAFRILLECDLKYPCFPWANFRTELKKAIEDRRIIDVRSAERWVACIKRDYTALQISKTDKAMSKAWRRHVEKNPPKYLNLLFDYEEDFGMTYNDKLKVSSIFETLSEYAAAYFVYTVQSSLIISNYSIRVDSLMIDMGNMPIWDADFFKRDARLLDSYSRHSKILDFDMLRLGTRMLADNPNRNAFGFGVYVISEIDKERKNGMDIAAMKIKTEECNQRNDLFNACLKMSRHACVIANKVFVKILCDLQRPEDWGAGGREVGEIIFIEKEGDLVPTLPVFSVFWLLERIYVRLKEKFDSFYTNFIVQRSDNTLSVFLLKWIFSKLEQYFDGVDNTFGAQTLHLDVESGRMDGKVKKAKYYRMPKKIYSRRYKTNCLSAIFQNAEVNTVSIEDFIEYADDMATPAELRLQNSHFYKERVVV